ncbi:PAM68-like [Dillenia turbinata]|uniref:PAM68-like n=1 Tax=Dillenia turbinata TaxID=194707 RepID=A0AAN8ZEK5_9MAGN
MWYQLDYFMPLIADLVSFMVPTITVINDHTTAVALTNSKGKIKNTTNDYFGASTSALDRSPQSLNLKSINSISDLKDLTSSRLDSLKRHLDHSHSEILKDIDSCQSRLHKRFKIQTQACQQVVDEAEKEYKKMLEQIKESHEAMKASYSEHISEVQASAARVCKTTIPELSQSFEKAMDALRSRFGIAPTSSYFKVLITASAIKDEPFGRRKSQPKGSLSSLPSLPIISHHKQHLSPIAIINTTKLYQNQIHPAHTTSIISAALKSPRGFGPSPKTGKKTNKSRKGDDEEDEKEEEEEGREAGVIPEIVTNRMISRMGFSVGIPLFIGLLFFPFIYYLKVGLKIDVPTWVPFLVSFIFFGTALLGVSYGIVSSSWDPVREGSLLGWNEAQKNGPLI